VSDFYGLPASSIRNDHLELTFLTGAGPRLVRLHLAGSPDNLLAELPDLKWDTPYGGYRPYGGHRLWHSPEAFPRTLAPDDTGLTVEPLPDGVRLSQPTEATTGIGKSIAVHLVADRPALVLHHQLQNNGVWPVELAPWAITQLPLGGLVVLPQPTAPLDGAGLLANRHLVLWPYTRWRDPRLLLDDDYILIDAQPASPPCKVGYFNRAGWAGYLYRGILFCKRFTPHPDRPHPDYHCNVESYCNDRFVEVETVAPLCRLEPGQAVIHTETWEFYPGLDIPPTIDGVRTMVKTLPLKTR